MTTKNIFKEKYEKFFQEKAASLVAEFNANRKIYRNEAVAQKIFIGFLIVFLLSFISLLVIDRIPIKNELKDTLMSLLGIGLFIVPVCVFLIIRYLSPQKTDFSTLRTETKLKNDLMPSLMNIFGNFTWHQKDMNLAYDFGSLLKTKIIPQNITAVGDDSMSGNYEGVNMNILEMHIGQNSFLLTLVLAVIAIPVLAGVIPLIGIPFGLVALIFPFPFVIVISLLSYFLFLAYFGVKLFYYIIKYFLVSGKFKGVMIELDMPKSFSGHTFVYENAISAQALRNTSKEGYQKVQLEDVDFSKRYTIYSTDQTEARYVLTPAFMERLKNISFAFDAKYLRMSFQNNKMILLASTDKDLFVMGNPFKDSDKTTFDTLFNEVYSVFCLVDELKLQNRI